MAGNVRAAGDRRQRATGGAVDGVGDVIASETWTGADGAAWPGQWSGVLGAGAIRDIVGNRGRLQPVAAEYAADACAYLSGMPDTADVELVTSFLPHHPDSYTVIYIRCDGNPLDKLVPRNGYGLGFGNGQAFVEKHIDGARLELSAAAYMPSNSVATAVRLRAVGTTIKAKWWPANQTEPAEWGWSGTDAVIGTGKVWLSHGNAVLPSSALFDDLTVRAATTSAVPGGGGSSGPTPTVTVPGAPTQVSAVSAASGQARVSWSAPISDGGSPITAYQIGRDSAGLADEGPYSTTWSIADPRGATFYDLIPTGTYTLSVAAINVQGVGPATTVTIIPNGTGGGTTDPPPDPATDPLIAPPQNFTLTPTPGGFSYDHEDVPAFGNFGRYEYQAGTTNPPTGPVISVGYSSDGTVVGLPQTPHYVRVRCVTTGGRVGLWSATKGPVTPLAPPAEPEPGQVDSRHLAHTFWTTPLPVTVPLASTSADYVRRLNHQATMGQNSYPAAYYPFPWNIAMNEAYWIPVYQMPLNTPRVKVWARDTTKTGLQAQLDKGVPMPNPGLIPGGSVPPAGTDGAVAIICGNEIWEMWQTAPGGPSGYPWQCQQAGYIANRLKHPGWWAGSPWFDGGRDGRVVGYDWGVSASGCAYMGGILTAEDYHGPFIPHPILMSLPITGPGTSNPSKLLPATRNDWINATPSGEEAGNTVRLPEGARFRLPHSFNIENWVAQKALPAAAMEGSTASVLRKILVCIRDYGIIVNEAAGTIGFSFEHPQTFGTSYNPYSAAQKPNWGNWGHQIPYTALVQVAPPTVDISTPMGGPA